QREATASAVITLSEEAFAAVTSGNAPKGDVLAAARIAGVMAGKKTGELIPLCHPLAITKANVEVAPDARGPPILSFPPIRTSGQTGVEMEALTAASIAALTIYDMVKALDKAAIISDVRLVAKSGGKSGDYRAPDEARKPEPFRPRVATRAAPVRTQPAVL